MQSELFENFHSEENNGFLQDCCITLIDKTDGSDPTRREEYWRVVLKIVAHYGLNWIKKVINTLTRVIHFFEIKSVNFVKCTIISVYFITCSF